MAKGINRRLIVNVQERGGSPHHHAAIEKHVRAILARMCSARLSNTLRITIKLRKKIGSGGNNILGESHPRDLSKSKTSKSKHYTVVILSTAPARQQWNTITHELQHVVQWATGRLAWRKTKTHGWATYWRPAGHVGAALCFPKESEPKWKDRPWEIEAIAAERKYNTTRMFR